MKRYFIAYKTWCNNEYEKIEKIINFDNKIDLIKILSEFSSDDYIEIIGLYVVNFKTSEFNELDVKLNKNFKLEIIGDN